MKIGVQSQSVRTPIKQQVQHTQIRVKRMDATKEAVAKVSKDLETIEQAISQRRNVSFVSEAREILKQPETS